MYQREGGRDGEGRGGGRGGGGRSREACMQAGMKGSEMNFVRRLYRIAQGKFVNHVHALGRLTEADLTSYTLSYIKKTLTSLLNCSFQFC